jgi:bifunctional non-homologous end joining protein LigD
MGMQYRYKTKEMNTKLHPSQFTIKNILERLQKKGDLFKDLLNPKISKANAVALAKYLQ